MSGYNLYYGWYVGELEQNDEFFDTFHKNRPEAIIGLSEFGADANPAYQSPNPEKGNWTEGYQALYHEHMLKMWSQRPYIWAMHCWNMFDFGADGRDEGGSCTDTMTIQKVAQPNGILNQIPKEALGKN